MTAKISSKGQVVIPVAIRRRYGMKDHSKVEFVDTGKEVVLVSLPADPFRASWGISKKVGSADLLAYRRAERRREQSH